MKKLLFIILALYAFIVKAQQHFPVNGVDDQRPNTYAFTNATVYQDYQTKIENATLIIKNGKISDLGSNISVPKDAQVIDLNGKYIYPTFIDPYTSYGIPKPERVRGGGGPPQYDTNNKEAFGWNEAVKSHYNAASEFKTNNKEAEELRKYGFGAVVSFMSDGVFRGTSVVASTGDEPSQNMLINLKASSHLSFDKGTSRQSYPQSIMGYSALIRQTYYDAKWYKSSGYKEQTNQSLKAVNELNGLPQIFEAGRNHTRLLLADKIGDEFGIQYIIKGNGDEYQRINEIKATNAALIIPLNFPDAYDVDDPMDALEVSISDLKHWELAPANGAQLAKAGISFAFTADGLKDKGAYITNIRKSTKYGLSESQALKAMTYTPAALVRMQDEVGSLRKGMRANFFISSDNIFSEKAIIYQTWIHGKKYVVNDINVVDLAGKYDLKVGDKRFDMEISGKAGKHSAKIIIDDSTNLKVDFKVNDNALSATFSEKDALGPIRLTGWIEGKNLKGLGREADASWVNWSATYQSKLEEKESSKDEKKDEQPEIGEVIYPFLAFGWKQKPQQETILFKNATIWTSDDAGKIEQTDLLIQNGKITQIGKDLTFSGARVIDASGKHITPGIIDEHSHVALMSVNEGSHSIVSEVRMKDAVDSEDISIYRQLSGGVTTAQLLHGSANPIDGQSAIIKFRWGAAPNDLIIKDADEYIKFALGENVKQSNWGDDNTSRFPQTRMGVEQVFMNGFTKAQAYDKAWETYNSLDKKSKAIAVEPRRDLQSEALAEIINKKRFITCHSYVQSEINMLMKVAENFNFNVNTFTHILEGYKVADKMAAHGAGGSTFSDWWAYKNEVRDAIPYNANLMTQAGVTVAINSDDGEMARRLNQEAGKSVKYGGMDEVEALKMVTINPAKLLHLDKRIGSIKVGKDADIVLWNDHPLSIYASAEMTLVDGIPYFEKEKDKQLRNELQAERARIIASMKEAKKGGAKSQKVSPKERHMWNCEEFDYINE